MKAPLRVNTLCVNQQPCFQFPNRIARRQQLAFLVRLAKERSGVFRESARLPWLARRTNSLNRHPERSVNECDLAGDQLDRQDIRMIAQLQRSRKLS